MLQAAMVHHLCYSVDYKRGVLEILLNSVEALITVSAFIHFSSVVCGLTYGQVHDKKAGRLIRYVHQPYGDHHPRVFSES